MNKDLLSMEEVGKIVGLTAYMAFNFVKQERLEIYPIGKTNCVDGKDLIEVLSVKQKHNRKELEKVVNNIIKERSKKKDKERSL